MKRLIAAVGMVLVTAACGTHTASSPTTVTVTSTATTAAAPVTPVTPVMPVRTPTEMRQWVNAGQLDFYVDYAFGGPDYGGDGEVRVTMYVKNTSGVPQTYLASAQGLMDDRGRMFAPKFMGSGGVSTSDPPGGAIDQFDLNPGLSSGEVYVYFKVPTGTFLEQCTLVVHGSPTSIGSPIHLHRTHG
jgi:hypothetical protein